MPWLRICYSSTLLDLVAVLGLSSPALAATVDSEWVLAVNGSWTNPANWRTNPVFPNDGRGIVPPAVEVLDRVRRAELLVGRSADAEGLQGERLVHALSNRRSRTGMIGFEGGGKTLETSLRHLRVAEAPRFPQNGLDVLLKTIRELTQDVPLIVDLAALEGGQWAEHLPDSRS